MRGEGEAGRDGQASLSSRALSFPPPLGPHRPSGREGGTQGLFFVPKHVGDVNRRVEVSVSLPQCLTVAPGP